MFVWIWSNLETCFKLTLTLKIMPFTQFLTNHRCFLLRDTPSIFPTKQVNYDWKSGTIYTSSWLAYVTWQNVLYFTFVNIHIAVAYIMCIWHNSLFCVWIYSILGYLSSDNHSALSQSLCRFLPVCIPKWFCLELTLFISLQLILQSSYISVDSRKHIRITEHNICV